MFNKLKQLKDIRDQAKQLQETLSKESITTKAAGGDVAITIDGNLTMTNITIAESLLSPDKKAKLEQAIKEAHGDALKKMQQVMAMKMKEMGGLPEIPGLS